MNKFIAITIMSLCALFALPAFAFNVPPIEGHVTDKTGQLSQADKASLNTKLDAINKSSANEIAVLIIPTLNGEAVEDVSFATAKAWKIGKAGADNGVLLVLAMQEHKIRIETGKGVGGALTDVQSSHIIREKIAPQMRRNNLVGAIDDGTAAIATALTQGGATKSAAAGSTVQPSNSKSPGGVLLAIFGGAIALMAGVFFFTTRPKRRKYTTSSYSSSSGLSAARKEQRLPEDLPLVTIPSVTSVATSSSYSSRPAPASSYSKPKPKPAASSSSSDSSSSSSGSSYGGGGYSGGSSSYDSGSSSYDSGSSGGGYSGGGGDFGGGGSSGDW